MSKNDVAKALHDEGFNCSQAVCAAYAADFGLTRADGLRISAAFGGGVGRTGQTCGAVSGALMVLGLKYGMTEADPKAKERMYAITQEYIARFTALHGTVLCRELLKADLTTPEGRRSIKTRNAHATICTKLIADATEILDDMLE
jgi:C_GCAxxG_C_C family probable redox protein